MREPVQTMSQAMRSFWHYLAGQGTPAAPQVALHDPAAERAHDLDDPYFDKKVQARMADVIAGAARKD